MYILRLFIVNPLKIDYGLGREVTDISSKNKKEMYLIF